ncbi:Os03g0293900 [Oryza sativa Japonica Group]|uniref:Os03g0293900 protein n=1 Tax=Oryza sativa subsp. japonica TaxID=39947 RepID=A0A0P0VX40_ORYSJ|nr:hypothetical protein EE612_016815 [Oryza sativa]BAS83695.1 Os03g0293900 [Oryza sativa Japonica Group]
MVVVALSIRSHCCQTHNLNGHDLPMELNSSSVLITRGDNEVKALVAPASLLAHNAELEGKWWFRRSRTVSVKSVTMR